MKFEVEHLCAMYDRQVKYGPWCGFAIPDTTPIWAPLGYFIARKEFVRSALRAKVSMNVIEQTLNYTDRFVRYDEDIELLAYDWLGNCKDEDSHRCGGLDLIFMISFWTVCKAHTWNAYAIEHVIRDTCVNESIVKEFEMCIFKKNDWIINKPTVMEFIEIMLDLIIQFEEYESVLIKNISLKILPLILIDPYFSWIEPSSISIALLTIAVSWYFNRVDICPVMLLRQNKIFLVKTKNVEECQFHIRNLMTRSFK